MGFEFLNPGPLIDGELELIAPTLRLGEEFLAACHHPLTRRDAPSEASTTRERLLDFLSIAPGGRQPADLARGWAPVYHFWMYLNDSLGLPPVRIAGGMGLRIGNTQEIELYSGHIGYHVYPPARGHHYSERACRLVLPLARRHGLSQLWITTNPDNYPSRRTCERLGAELVEVVTLPRDHPFRLRGETAKCRYLLKL